MDWTSYEKPSGRILYFGDAANEQECLLQGENVIVGKAFDDADFYVVDGEAVPRPTLSISPIYLIEADGVDTVKFPLIEGTVVTFSDDMFTAGEDEEFEFLTDYQGTYTFNIDPPFPYLSMEVIINAI